MARLRRGSLRLRGDVVVVVMVVMAMVVVTIVMMTIVVMMMVRMMMDHGSSNGRRSGEAEAKRRGDQYFLNHC